MDAVPPAVPVPLRISLLIVGWFHVLTCLAGGVGLSVGGGLGIPVEWLADTPFSDYVVPGLLLGIVVGGVQLVAVVAQHARLRLAWGLHAAAGLVMAGWIFVEIALLLVWSPLQGIFFATGVLQVVLAVLALGAWPSPFLARERWTPDA